MISPQLLPKKTKYNNTGVSELVKQYNRASRRRNEDDKDRDRAAGRWICLRVWVIETDRFDFTEMICGEDEHAGLFSLRGQAAFLNSEDENSDIFSLRGALQHLLVFV